MDREEYIDKLAAKLREWNSEIEKLEAKMEGAKAEKRGQYRERIEKLRSRRDAGRDKLEELKRADSRAWEDLKHGVERAFDEIERALKSALSEFK